MNTPGGNQKVGIVNEPWFVLTDVCKVLGIVNDTRTKSQLNPVDLHTVKVYGTERNRTYDAHAVNESGLDDALDRVVDKAMGATRKLTTERQRQEILFQNYSRLTR